MYEELNKKLAEWAGFRQGTHVSDNFIEGHYRYRRGDTFWKRPDDTGVLVSPPKFTESLDACFKWLVPKLFSVVIWRIYTTSKYGVDVSIENQPIYFGGAETPALALCLAIEKQIGGEND